jgi:GNAT superfamily N-acetyltransferase
MFPIADMVGSPDLLIATVDDQIVGYAHVRRRWTWAAGVREYLLLGYVLPAWRNNGIGSWLHARCQLRIRELAAKEQHDGPR